MLRVDYWISRLESSYLEKFVVLILTELKTKQTNLKWQLKTLTVELGGLFKILLDFWLIMKWNRHWLSINDSVWILSGFLRMLKRPFAFLRYRWANWRQRTKIDVVDVASATKSQPPSAATAKKSALESYCNYFFFFKWFLPPSFQTRKWLNPATLGESFTKNPKMMCQHRHWFTEFWGSCRDSYWELVTRVLSRVLLLLLMKPKAGIGCPGGSERQLPVRNPALGDGKAEIDGRLGHALAQLPQITARCLFQSWIFIITLDYASLGS